MGILKVFDHEYKELNIKRDTFIIGHIGRFSWQKNHDFIINIFEQIQKEKKIHAYYL